MTRDRPTPEQLKAFLDDLARISLRHGVFLYSDEHNDGCMTLARADANPHWQFAGYSADSHGVVWPENSAGLDRRETLLGQGIAVSSIESIDLTQLSAHERLEIMSNRRVTSDPPPQN